MSIKDTRWAYDSPGNVVEPPKAKRKAGVKAGRPEAAQYINWWMQTLGGHRLLSAFAPHESDVPDLRVQLEAGVLFDGATRTEVAAQQTAPLTAPAADPRKDLVYIDHVTGIVGVVTGVEDAAPTALPPGKVPIAIVNLAVGQTAILNSHLEDLRYPGADFAASKGQANGVAGLDGSGIVPQTQIGYRPPISPADIIVGSPSQVSEGKATHSIDNFIAAVTNGAKVVFLDGIHTLVRNEDVTSTDVDISGQSTEAILAFSSYTFSISGQRSQMSMRISGASAGALIGSAQDVLFEITGADYTVFALSNGARGKIHGTMTVEVLSGSGTWIKPNDVSMVFLTAAGGGGSGGVPSLTSDVSGGGGGGGGLVSALVPITGDTLYNIGLGGAAVTNAGNGLAGGKTNFGPYQVGGGKGGYGLLNGSGGKGACVSTFYAGVIHTNDGGTGGSDPDFGGYGYASILLGPTIGGAPYYGGSGGSCLGYGGGGATIVAPGTAGVLGGGGGGGFIIAGTTTLASGAGGDGIVILAY